MARQLGRTGDSPAGPEDKRVFEDIHRDIHNNIPKDGPDDRMTLVEHLDELRRRLLWSLLPWAASVLASLWLAEPVLAHLSRPVERLVILSPGEAFLIHLRLAVYIGTAIVSPWLLYQLVAFVQPALTPAERRQILWALPPIFLLLFLGTAFGYGVILPFILNFFLSFTGPGLETAISVSSYVSFVLGTVTPFAVVFQLPVVVWVLARLGVFDDGLLRRIRRWSIFIIFVVSAFLTPPDVVSQVLMAIPLLILYELSIFVARLGARQRARAQEQL